ncbi:MAG TPA: transporter substrate-binding domain-containing protein [Desulfomonilia bacterium]|nr:transporter substrate-binding domain-containing protein [Desulfomonilia bacterium]
MNKLIISALTGIVIYFLLSSPAFSARTLVVAVNPNWPPMEMKDKKGKITGYEIDLIKAVGEEAGFKVKLVDVPWKNIFKGLDAGKYDVIVASISITDARKEKYDFSDPYYTVEQLLVVPKAKADEPCREKTIAAFKLTTGAETLRLYQKTSITFYTVEEIERAFKDLSKGFIDGVFCDSPVAMNYTEYENRYKNKFAIASLTLPENVRLPTEDYGMAVRKGNAETLDLINRGLQAVKDKGIETRIRTKWIKSSDPAIKPQTLSKAGVTLDEHQGH